MEAVVITHNSARDLANLLECKPLQDAFDRIVVVDNASTDASCETARAGGAHVLERGVNDSLSAAINAGVRECTSDLIAILNPDVLVDDASVIDELARAFDDPAVGLSAPMLRLPDGSLQDSARTVPSPVELAQRRLQGTDTGALRPDDGAHDVPWVVGAFMLVRREAFWSVGGFDERYKLYFEDVDFCVRLWTEGWRVRIDSRLVVRHEHQASSRKSLVGWAIRQHARSAMRFYATHPDLLAEAGRERLVRPPRTRHPGLPPRQTSASAGAR